jgi:hypothetical protein
MYLEVLSLEKQGERGWLGVLGTMEAVCGNVTVARDRCERALKLWEREVQGVIAEGLVQAV